MRALDLNELTKRWRVWRELDHLQHSLGLSPFGDGTPADASDDACAEALPEDLLVPRPPRLD